MFYDIFYILRRGQCHSTYQGYSEEKYNLEVFHWYGILWYQNPPYDFKKHVWKSRMVNKYTYIKVFFVFSRKKLTYKNYFELGQHNTHHTSQKLHKVGWKVCWIIKQWYATSLASKLLMHRYWMKEPLLQKHWDFVTGKLYLQPDHSQLARKFKKSPGQKNLWNQIKQFPKKKIWTKIHFLPFEK